MTDTSKLRETPETDAVRIAHEFLSAPDTRAKLKVQLCLQGLSLVADMIDEAVIVSSALINLERQRDELVEALRYWLSDDAGFGRRYWNERAKHEAFLAKIEGELENG